MTGAQKVFGVQTGSVYTLDDKPSNVVVTGSPYLPNNIIQPGGILNVNDPHDKNVQFLVDYNSKKIVLTSGLTAGASGIGWIGSGIYIDYQRSTPLVNIKTDSTSISSYGTKMRTIIDRNVKDISEANIRATTYLADHKDPKTQGRLEIYGVVSVIPGNTAVVDIPYHNIVTQTYSILNASYTFNKTNNLSDKVLTVTMNKRISNFIDYMKEQELRLRTIEGSEVDTSITSLELTIGSFSVASSGVVISRSIGSSFYFHVSAHNILNSDGSLLGDMRAGSIIGALA